MRTQDYTFTCEGCWQDFDLGVEHDMQACITEQHRLRQAQHQAYNDSLPCCKDFETHGHKGCQAAILDRGLEAPRRDCNHYCTLCVPAMRVSAEQEAVAEAIFKSMRRVRISWANLDRVGQDHYRKAAKAALRAIATKTTKSEA